MWRGGISQRGYTGFHQKLKDRIRERDNYVCQLCGRTEEELKYRLSIHHINFDKGDNQGENLIALCKACNSRINTDREKWTKHFQEQIASISGSGQQSIIIAAAGCVA